MAALSALPNELLSLITGYLERPKDLLFLSLTCRRLSDFVKLDGWKALLKGRFGVSGLNLDAQASVHGLTTLYRNWHRKGLLARYLEPSFKAKSLNDWKLRTWQGPQGQTMGYQPCIDSYEEVYGSWGERREVLAWSAGTTIVLRVREAGSGIETIRQAGDDLTKSHEQNWTYDDFGHLSSWYTYKVPESSEGRDDITSLRLLRTHQRDLAYETVVFGTASGDLAALSVSPDLAETQIQHYNTGRRAIGSLSVSASSSPIIATTVGDSLLTLYPVHHQNHPQIPIQPLSQVRPITSSSRIWSCNFLSDTRVSVGLGPCRGPIQIYEIAPEGLLPTPLRTFNLESDDRADARPRQRNSSVYPILPLSDEGRGGTGAGHAFLSGGYDGIVRLHDMRSPRSFETMYWDPTNDSPIYALAAHGLERVVVGVSMHSMIKVFDLRLSGSHAYYATTTPLPSANKPKQQDYTPDTVLNHTTSNATVLSGGWNLFLNPRVPPKPGAYRAEYWRGREDSPVYSLSIPSPTSQHVYAGLEGVVQSLTFHSFTDKHPDPMLSLQTGQCSDSNDDDGPLAHNLPSDVLNLGMYEQGSEEGLGMQLLVQGDVVSEVNETDSHGRDDRWKDIRNSEDRWARGENRQRQGRGGGRAGRRRGRG